MCLYSVLPLFLFSICRYPNLCSANHYLANFLLAAIQKPNFFIITYTNFSNGLTAIFFKFPGYSPNTYLLYLKQNKDKKQIKKTNKNKPQTQVTEVKPILRRIVLPKEMLMNFIKPLKPDFNRTTTSCSNSHPLMGSYESST